MQYHEPVMMQEVLELLDPSPGDVYYDGTAGSCGHAARIAPMLGSEGVLIAGDRDPAMLKIGRERLLALAGTDWPRMYFAVSPYERVEEIVQQVGVQPAKILLDLGFNSLQLEDASRGFSFSKDGPLDGRYNPEEGGPSVADLVNSADVNQLAGWIRELSEERYSRPIARAIVEARRKAPITTTGALERIIWEAYPAAERHARLHPATRTFQALRLVANGELEAVERGVAACLQALRPGGTMVCISFHSGEDRIVKQLFRANSSPRPDPGNIYSATTMVGVEFVQEMKGALECSEEEAARNPRARSAKVRAIRRRREGEL